VVAVARRHALPASLVVLLAAVATSACRNAAPQPAPYEQAELALRRGELQAAQAIVDSELSAEAPDDSEQAWRYQLLRAEILLARVDLAGALPILTATLPTDGAFESLRARQQYLLAKAQVVQGSLDTASQTVGAAIEAGRLPRELEWEAKVLDGQSDAGCSPRRKRP
jgi:outer membrane PBP1 activator LpoA protein